MVHGRTKQNDWTNKRSIPGGTRTRSLRFWRPTHYPLGHRDCYNEMYTLISSWVIVHGRTKQKDWTNKRSIPGGTRTRSFRFWRSTHYPLGHRDCYNVMYTLISSWVIVRGRTKQKLPMNKFSIPGGTRTRSLRFRRPTPSPLGHRTVTTKCIL